MKVLTYCHWNLSAADLAGLVIARSSRVNKKSNTQLRMTLFTLITLLTLLALRDAQAKTSGGRTRRYATINPISQSEREMKKCKYLDCYLITHRKGEKGHLDYQ